MDAEGKLVGVVTRGDILRALQDDELSPETPAIAVGSEPPIVAYPDEPVAEAVVRMLRNSVGRLPVVSRDQPDQLIGWLTRAHAMGARLRRIEEEHVRDAGWLFLRRGSGTRSRSERT